MVGLTQADVATGIGRRYLDGFLIGLLSRRPVPSRAVPVAQSHMGLCRCRGSLNRRLELDQRFLWSPLGLIGLTQADVAIGAGRRYLDGLLIGLLGRCPICLQPVPVAQGHVDLAEHRGGLNRRLELGQRLFWSPLSLIGLTQTDVSTGLGSYYLNGFLVRFLRRCPIRL